MFIKIAMIVVFFAVLILVGVVSRRSSTMPDFFGLRFSSRALRLCSAVIVFVFLIPYTASLFNGLSQLFSTAFSGIGYVWWVLIMAVLTGVYVIVGGYMVPAVSLLTRKKTPGNLDEMFSCYDRTVTVPVSTSLSKEN